MNILDKIFIWNKIKASRSEQWQNSSIEDSDNFLDDELDLDMESKDHVYRPNSSPFVYEETLGRLGGNNFSWDDHQYIFKKKNNDYKCYGGE